MIQKQIHILVLGAYGGAGRTLCKQILEHIPAKLTVAGRNLSKIEHFAETLRLDYPDHGVVSVQLDASNQAQLISTLQDVDLLLVVASVPDLMEDIAKAVLETNTDMIDILLRGDVVDKLMPYRETALQRGRTIITQAGFHPGMIAPIIRLGKTYVDSYEDARIFMAMEAVFEKPAACHELLYELVEGNSQILENGHWRKANWKDAIDYEFSDFFGKKSCFPLQMREMEGLEIEMELKNMGTYAAGFDNYIDNYVFPLVMALGYLHKKLAIRLGGNLIFRHVKKKLGKKLRVEFHLQAKGLVQQKEKTFRIEILSHDGYLFTAQPVIACIKQYLEGRIKPGLHLMGQVVDEWKLVEDLKQMGLEINMPVLQH